MPDELSLVGRLDALVGELDRLTVLIPDAQAAELRAVRDALIGELPNVDEAICRPAVAELEELLAGARKDERAKVAQLLDDHATEIATFAADAEQLVAMLAFILRLGG